MSANCVPVVLDRKVVLKSNQVKIDTFRFTNLNECSYFKEICLLKPSCRSFAITQNVQWANELLNTQDTTVTIKRGSKLGYALPLNTNYQSRQNGKQFEAVDSHFHAEKNEFW